MRSVIFACVLGVLLLQPELSRAFILTFPDVEEALARCPGATTSRADVVKGQVFAFIQSSMAMGSGNLLTLQRTFALSRDTIKKDNDYEAFAQCAKEKAADILTRAGVRLIHKIPDLDPEFRNRSFAFFPNIYGTSISAYRLARVRKDYRTHIEISAITCDALFSVAYAAYPTDALQPGWEPTPSVQQAAGPNFEIELNRDSKEVAQAIEEMSRAIGASERTAYENFIKDNPDELWLWINLTTKEKACSALMSVREEAVKQ